MTEQIAHRDLRNRSAEILREVRDGASYEITNHGEVVALIGPPAASDRLGIRQARKPRNFSSLPRSTADLPTTQALTDLRAE